MLHNSNFAKFYCHDAEETEKVARAFAKELAPGAIVAFFGELAAGKTTFIRALASEVAGIDPGLINSPTFQYLNIYNGRLPVYHFDLYRLRGAEDFLSLGFEELLHSDGICCIEWAERIVEILPKNTILVRISHLTKETRLLEITK